MDGILNLLIPREVIAISLDYYQSKVHKKSLTE